MSKFDKNRILQIINFFYQGRGAKANFARLTKTSPILIDSYIAGRRNPGNIFKERLRKLNVNMEWFETGEGDMIRNIDNNILVADSRSSYGFKVPVYGNVYCGYPAPPPFYIL